MPRPTNAGNSKISVDGSGTAASTALWLKTRNVSSNPKVETVNVVGSVGSSETNVAAAATSLSLNGTVAKLNGSENNCAVSARPLPLFGNQTMSLQVESLSRRTTNPDVTGSISRTESDVSVVPSNRSHVLCESVGIQAASRRGIRYRLIVTSKGQDQQKRWNNGACRHFPPPRVISSDSNE
jgi:hypothetical protein